MRIIAIATFCALAAIPAQAQQVERIKARGANAAGVCAGSLDMLGQYMSRAQNPDPQQIQEVQQGRDFFADMQRYSRAEISAAATAFVTLMTDRIRNAPSTEAREAVQRELVTVSRGCLTSVKDELRRFREAAPDPVPGQTITPLPTQPSVVQPYTVEPMILDPITPAQ